MRAVPCPVPPEKLRCLYEEEKLTDQSIADLIGEGATLKRVRSWRHRFGIGTIHRSVRYKVSPIEGPLRALLIGSMLGDGRLSRTTHASRYHENHSDDQRGYLEWKHRQWGSWVGGPIKPVTWHHLDRDFYGWRFHTVSHASLNEWHDLFYDSKGPKRLDPKIVNLVDDFALSVWFMDDGSTGWWPRITFGMNPKSWSVAMGIFETFGLHPRWEVYKGNTGSFYFNGVYQANRFITLVRPYVISVMPHKLRFGFQGSRRGNQ